MDTDDEIWREVFDRRMNSMEVKLDANTEATQKIADSTKEVVDLLTSMRAAMRLLEGLAKLLRPIGWIAGAAAAVWGLVVTLKGGGK